MQLFSLSAWQQQCVDKNDSTVFNLSRNFTVACQFPTSKQVEVTTQIGSSYIIEHTTTAVISKSGTEVQYPMGGGGVLTVPHSLKFFKAIAVVSDLFSTILQYLGSSSVALSAHFPIFIGLHLLNRE